MLPCLTNDVALLYYNAFIRSRFSYCTVFWFNNLHTCKQRLIDKINALISVLAVRRNLSFDEFVTTFHVFDVSKVYQVQSVSLLYDVTKSRNDYLSIQFVYNNDVHSHFTRGSTNIHIGPVTTCDSRNFIYNGIINWNACPAHLKLLPKRQFVYQYKRWLFSV